MTQREHKLAIVFGSAVALFALWMIVRGAILNPIWEARNEVDRLRTEEAALVARVNKEAEFTRQWNDLRSKTLAGDPNTAAGQLDAMMKKLMRESGLINPSVSVGQPHEQKKVWPGLYIIPYTVTMADGTMEDFTRFLHAFYQQPYAMRILSFNLDQPPVQGRAKPLHISSLLIEAIALSDEGMPKSVTAIRPDAKPIEPAKPWRPADADLKAYEVLWNRKFMEPFRELPPPPPPAVPQTPQVAMVMINPGGGTFTGPVDVRLTCGTEGATIRYTTDGSNPTATSGHVYDNAAPIHMAEPLTIKAVAFKDGMKDSPPALAVFAPPPAPPLKLVGTWTYGPRNEAVFMNEQTKEPLIVLEGESFDGGKMLLCLPEAVVVEMPDGPRFVIWLDKSVREKEQLDPARQPDVAAAVEILVEPQ